MTSGTIRHSDGDSDSLIITLTLLYQITFHPNDVLEFTDLPPGLPFSLASGL